MAKEFDILNLLRLQIVESMISSRLREVECLIKNENLVKLKKEYSQAKEDLEQRKKDFSSLEANRKKIDDKVQSNQEKIKSNQEKLFSGTIGNSKELLNYQEEIKSLEVQNSKMEDEEIEIMMQIEEMEEELSSAKQNFGEKEQKLNNIKDDISKKAKKIEAELESLKKKRKYFISTIPPEQLEKYNKVKQRKGGIAVTVIKDNFCSGCNMEIPVADAEKIKDPGQVYKCPLCGRLSIIYTEQVDQIKQEMEI